MRLEQFPRNIFTIEIEEVQESTKLAPEDQEWRITDVKTSYDSNGVLHHNNHDHCIVEITWRRPEVRSFERFNSLPYELSHRIWTLALPDPRIILLRCDDEYCRRSRCDDLDARGP
ncbi:hypothetical protein VTL71DRAFT_1336 [Oculimacula yallundae]|uniref:2EXR domain-containing protein n=1 Tax=Oculimacula yallundae TaxID=86028 RepID=A0ABR4CB72_9HELO